MFGELVCPKCKRSLLKNKGGLLCGKCEKTYLIASGVAVMWRLKDEKKGLSKNIIKNELQVSQKMVADKSLGNEYWDRLEEKNYAARSIDKKAFGVLKKLLPDIRGLKVLVIGCGGGKDIEWLLKNGAKKVVGTDVSLDLIRVAQKRFFQSKSKPNWYFIANAESLPLKNDSFDLVLFASALHHIPQYKQALISACKISPIVAFVAEPAKMGMFNSLLKRFDWCTEYGKLKTHRFDKKELKKFMQNQGYQAVINTDFVWFPLGLLKPLSNNKLFVGIYFMLLSLADKIIGRWGHNVTMVAKRK